MSEQNKQVVDSLWKDFEPDLKAERAEHWQRHQAEQVRFSGSHLREEDTHCQFADRLQIEVYRKMKEELGDKILMKLSEPSRFEVLYVNTLIRIGAEVKRALSPEFQKDIDAIGIGAKYDVEQDIQDTEAALKEKIESKFKLEMLYWSALDEQRYEDAKAFLLAIELTRSNALVTLQIEILNWKLDLSLKLKDIVMFMQALRKAIGLSEQVEFQDFKKSLEDGVYDLLTQTVLKELIVVPSSFGLKQAQKSSGATQSYFDEQARLFARGVASETIARLCVTPQSRFLSVARAAFEDKRRAFLLVNPCLKEIRAGWS